MTVVSAFLIPGSPLPRLRPDVPGWARFNTALGAAREALHASEPDVVLLYSTQWFAVLDELWLTRKRSTDIHVDENWHEYGELAYDIHVDVALAHSCIDACPACDVHAKGVDYESFPLDSGTIVAANGLGIGTEALPLVVAANNLYHSAETTEQLAALVVDCARRQGKRVAVVGVGGLSGGLFTAGIDPASDRISSPADDSWNLQILELISQGQVSALRQAIPSFAKETRADMGLKHLHWILGALDGRFDGARVHHYGALYGTGAAVVEFSL